MGLLIFTFTLYAFTVTRPVSAIKAQTHKMLNANEVLQQNATV
jgi:hypothetical protein